MLERVAQKLRLDQLVIQQGRTQQAKGTLIFIRPLEWCMVSSKLTPIHSAAANKEELLEMITHGLLTPLPIACPHRHVSR